MADQPKPQQRDQREESTGPEPWSPGQGRLFRAIAWAILLMIALCVVTLIVLWVSSLGHPAPATP